VSGVDSSNSQAIFPKVETTVPVTETGYVRVREEATTIAAQSQLSVAIAMTGTYEADLPMLYQMSGQCRVSGNNAVNVAPFIGRLDGTITTGTGSGVNQIDNPCWLPMDAINSVKGVDDWTIEASVNTCALVGLLAPGSVLDTDLLLMGWHLANHDTTNAAVCVLDATIGVHRYVKDLDTFDPVR
jgi:hypothetical protein